MGNIAYYDDINEIADRNIILLRNKKSVLGSMVRRGAPPVASINNINNFYKFAEYYAERDGLLVLHCEDIISNYKNALCQVAVYLGYKPVQKVYFGVKPTLSNTADGKTRSHIDVDEVQKHLDGDINEKQADKLKKYLQGKPYGLYEKLLNCGTRRPV